jgi:hypothetical protein
MTPEKKLTSNAKNKQLLLRARRRKFTYLAFIELLCPYGSGHPNFSEEKGKKESLLPCGCVGSKKETE